MDAEEVERLCGRPERGMTALKYIGSTGEHVGPGDYECEWDEGGKLVFIDGFRLVDE